MPAALADLIHQQRTQEPVDDMYDSFCVCDISLVSDNLTSPIRPPFIDRFAHPYQYELDHLTVPDELLSKPDPQVGPGKLSAFFSTFARYESFVSPFFSFLFLKLYKPIEETKCSFVDTVEDLVALNEKLCKLTEFAVDLEVRNTSKACYMIIILFFFYHSYFLNYLI